MTAPHQDVADLWFLVRKCAALLDRDGEAMFREGLGISLAQFMVLSVVDAHPGAFNQQTVADLLGLTKGTVSRQIDAASTAGLLAADVSPMSRRDKVVRLTSRGERIVRRGDELLESSTDAHFDGIDPADLAVTVRTLSALMGRMDAGARPPSAHPEGRIVHPAAAS